MFEQPGRDPTLLGKRKKLGIIASSVSASQSSVRPATLSLRLKRW